MTLALAPLGLAPALAPVTTGNLFGLAALASRAVNDPRVWDRAMMARVRVGDDVALGAIVDRYGGAVHAAARPLVGVDLANDVTQEVFLGLWEHPDRFDPDRGGLRTYLVVAARRRAIDVIRSRERRQARETRAGRPELGGVATVETEALAAVAGSRVRAAVGRLPDDQRKAIELAYLGGLTFRDVAREMGTPEGTAKSRLRLGLARLARELDAEREREADAVWS